MQSKNMISVENLSVIYNSRNGPVKALNKVSWQIDRGESIGLCGESGSGKTSAALAITQLLPSSIKKIEGKIFFENTDLFQLSDKDMKSLRGKHIAMIFQETMTSLNPALTIGKQICESLIANSKLGHLEARQKAIQLLMSVGMPSAQACLNKYPHQLSGGMQQRAMIAIAISCEPDVLIADEPMSALDSTLQLQIKSIFKNLKSKHKMSLVLISHDINFVSDICDKIVIMYDGFVVEIGPAKILTEKPGHPYTTALLGCIPRSENIGQPLQTIKGNLINVQKDLPGCIFAPRCDRCMIICKEENPPFFDLGNNHQSACWQHVKKRNDLCQTIDQKNNSKIFKKVTDRVSIVNTSTEQLLTVKNLSVTFDSRSLSYAQNKIKAVKNVSFSINKGETFGLIGESGCGKTTLAKTIMGLYTPEKGKVIYRGQDIFEADKNPYRKKMQYIFQDPYGSLNPRMTVKNIISEALDISKLLTEKQKRFDFLQKIMRLTNLNQDALYRYPHEFSGGQRQRIAIARSLAAQPEFIICDEPVSALDVSVRAQILNVLADLQNRLKLTYLFISHDLSIIRHVSDRIGVMYHGQLVEICSKTELFNRPLHPYTRNLFASSSDASVREIVPVLKTTDGNKNILDTKFETGIFSARCEYLALCNHYSQFCLTKEPVMHEVFPGHLVRCHLAEKLIK